MAKLRGFDVKTNWKPDANGQIMLHVSVKRWYMPFMMFQGLRKSGIPRRYWPLFYWQYYVTRRLKHA